MSASGVGRARALAVVAVLAGAALAAGPGFAKPRHIKPARKARGGPPSAGAEAEGRKHLKKAKALAAHGDCKGAVDEYTQAFDRLNDPEVLLARAECFRRLGQADEAVGDYRAYLDASPEVTNKAEIEAKIAALEGGASAAPAPVAKEKPRAEPSPPVIKERPRLEPPPVAKERPRPEPIVAPAPPAPVASPPAAHPSVAQPPFARTPPAAAPPPVVEIEVGESPAPPAAAQPTTAGLGSRRLWLWSAIAVVVAGAAVAGGYLYFRPSDPTTTGALGSYRF